MFDESVQKKTSITIDGKEMAISSEEQLRQIGQECVFLANELSGGCTISKTNGILHMPAHA